MSEEKLLCPTCAAENDALNKTCVQCGQSLIMVCPRCNTVNAITAEKCFACGQHFDTLGQIMVRHEIRTGDRFTRQAATATAAKGAEKDPDQARTDQLWAQERERQAYLQAQKLRQKQQERYLLIAVGIMAVVIVLLLLLITFTPS